MATIALKDRKIWFINSHSAKQENMKHVILLLLKCWQITMRVTMIKTAMLLGRELS